mmetsp:Transcript_42617/g.102761  ORF Transcript_42617/g.102761 Transcript_42617/m.102761 type:complete len:516 (-) Transcript_42617:71-1618(-)
MMKPTPNEVFTTIREQLSVSLHVSLEALQQQLEQASQGDDTIKATAFDASLRSIGVFLTSQDLGTIRRHCAGRMEKSYSISRFLGMLREQLPPYRQRIVNELWESLSQGRPTVSVDEILQRFDASKHPLVVSLELPAEKVHEDFGIALGRLSRDGMIEKEAIEFYYKELSACMSPARDHNFAAAVLEAFHLIVPHEVSKEHMAHLEMLLMDKFRMHTTIGQDGLHEAVRKYAHMQDQANTGGLGVIEFRGLVHSLGLTLPDNQVVALFEHLAADCGGGRVAIDHLESVMQVLNAGPCEVYNYKTTALQSMGSSGSSDPVVLKIFRILTKKDHTKKDQTRLVRRLFEAFREADKERRHGVPHKDFSGALWQCGIRLGSQEELQLRNLYDQNRDGSCRYPDFLDTIHSLCSRQVPARMAMIEELWNALAGPDAPAMRSSDFKEAYQPAGHPHVVCGWKTVAQSKLDMENFLGEALLLDAVTLELFTNYMMMESSCISDFSDFQSFVQNGFLVSGAAA